MTRQWLFLVPCALGALGLFLARIAGDGTAGFYWATAFTAVVYAAAWWLWGNRQAFMGPKKLIDVLRGALIGAALALVFVLGALVVQHTPVVNGIGEELVFRDVVPRQLRGMGQSAAQAGVWSTLVYCLVTFVMGVPLLVFAAGVLGAVAYLEAAKTGRLYSPIAVHLTWSIGMLLILPQFF